MAAGLEACCVECSDAVGAERVARKVADAALGASVEASVAAAVPVLREQHHILELLLSCSGRPELSLSDT